MATKATMAKIAARWPELLAFIVLLEASAAALLVRRFQIAGHIPWTDYYVLWLVPAACIFMLVFCFQLWNLFRAGEENPTKALLGKLRSIPPRSYVEVLVPIIVMAPFLASYTTFKVLMVNFTSHGADPMLARLDGIFGFQPWQLTHAIIGPMGTYVLDRLYFSWFIVNQVMLMAILFVPKLARQRAQLLLSFVFVWIVLGSVVAILLPSVGPCYYGKLYHPDTYADLMARLSTISQTYPLTALGVQERLWVDHSQDLLGLGSGISAMPSMHVAIATLTALLLRRLGLSLLGWFWLAAISIGSVHLGWHYASDGIVSIVVTVLIWKACAILLAQGHSPRDMRASALVAARA